MIQMIEANWMAFALALLIGLIVAWWIFARGTKRDEPRSRRPDVLDEGAAPAQRNQALIDAPSASSAAIVPPPAGGAMAGVAEVIAVAAQDQVEAAEASIEHVPEVPVAPVQPVIDPPAPLPDAAAAGDDLSRIKGLGPKLQALLPTLGLATYAQIAALTDADLAELDGKLGAFAGRPARDNWVEQAKFLAAGDVAGFEGKFGKV